MPPKPLKIDSLLLDLQNPRIKVASDQRDAMAKILVRQKGQIINLVENIAAKGLSPMNRLLVLRSPRPSKFIVLEGNRRVLALKLLRNAALVDDLPMSDAFRRRIRKAAIEFKGKQIEPLDCFEVDSREQGNDWLRQRHVGEDEGRGTVGWDSVELARFKGREPSLQVFDFVIEHGGFSEEEKEKLSTRFPLTTLDRLVSSKGVREQLGIRVEDGKVVTNLPLEELIKPLKKIVLDLATKAKTVSDLKVKDQQEAYIRGFGTAHRVNLQMATSTEGTLDELTPAKASGATGSTPPRQKVRRPAERKSVVPKSCKVNIPVPKIEAIFRELESLKLSEHKHAIAVLLRVFLELSIDEFLTKVVGAKLKWQPPGGNRIIDKTLRIKVEESIDYLAQNGMDKKDFIGITRGLTDVNHPFSIDTLHAYIHNRFFTPTENQLTTAWDNAQHFFETIWP